MERWCAMRDYLRTEPLAYVHLDAAQLVKHAFGLVSEGRRSGKRPVLLYLFAEPTKGRNITPEQFALHRKEIKRFGESVAGAAVRFEACSWREWLGCFEGEARDHAQRVLERFSP